MSRKSAPQGPPLVSICMPTYGHPDEAERALHSIMSQTMRDWELIVSDDSADDSVERVVRAALKGRSERLHYSRNSKPLGPIYNWNAAIRPASGRYIKVLFSDDYLTDAHSLERYVSMLEDSPEAGLAFSGSRQVLLGSASDLDYQHGALAGQEISYTREGLPYYERYSGDDFIERLESDYRYLFTGNEIGAPSAVIFRRLPDGTLPLFDEESGFASDMFLYFDILRACGGRFAWTREPLISIGMHAGQYTETFSEMDERIYADMRLLYEKNDLRQAPFCREHMTRAYILPWHRGREEAMELGISEEELKSARRDDLRRSISDFVRSRWRSFVR